MKKNLLLMLLAAATVIISCSKDDDDDDNGGGGGAATNTSKLCNKNWKLKSILINGVESIGFIDSCDLDNFTRFNTNNTYTDDEGATKCDTADPQTSQGIWSWAANETQLVIDSIDVNDVLINSGTILKIRQADTTIAKVEITLGL